LSAGLVEAGVIGEVVGSSSLVAAVDVGVRRVPVPVEVIVAGVRRYPRFDLSYRDVEELLVERGVEVDHVTGYRWAQRFTPLLGRRGPVLSPLTRRQVVRRRPADNGTVDDSPPAKLSEVSCTRMSRTRRVLLPDRESAEDGAQA
jgi:hypothetical protein